MGALDGKVAIVTGGAQGIGAAIAAGLEAEGATVVIADLDPPEGGIRADVSSEEDVSRMVEETLERHGRIDVLVNNAGLYASLEMRAFTEIPLEEWNRVMEVNVASMFLTCRAVVPVMREQGGGKIVNISSGTPFRGVPFLLHYVTSKGAIVALTRALAKELGKDSIHVNCVAPGFTMSDGVKSHPEVVEKLRDVSVAVAHDPARPGARGRRRRGRLPLHAGRRLHHRPDDGHRRRPVLPLSLDSRASRRRARRGRDATSSTTSTAGRGVLRRGDGERACGRLGARRSRARDTVLRCDRVDFPPGGVAYRHVHPGPGIRRILYGELTIDRGDGDRARTAPASPGTRGRTTPCSRRRPRPRTRRSSA